MNGDAETRSRSSVEHAMTCVIGMLQGRFVVVIDRAEGGARRSKMLRGVILVLEE